MSLAGGSFVEDGSVSGSDDTSERDGAHSARSMVSKSSSSAADEESLSSLAAAILSRLSHDETEDLPVRAHKSAAEKMHKMHQLLRMRSEGADVPVDSETRTLLLFAGLRMQRRVSLARSDLAAADVEHTHSALRASSADGRGAVVRRGRDANGSSKNRGVSHLRAVWRAGSG